MLKDTNTLRDAIFFIAIFALIRNISELHSHELPPQETAMEQYAIQINNHITRLERITYKLLHSPQLKKEAKILKDINRKVKLAKENFDKQPTGLFIMGPFEALFSSVKEYNTEKKLYKLSHKIGLVINQMLKKQNSALLFINQKNIAENLNLIEQIA